MEEFGFWRDELRDSASQKNRAPKSGLWGSAHSHRCQPTGKWYHWKASSPSAKALRGGGFDLLWAQKNPLGAPATPEPTKY